MGAAISAQLENYKRNRRVCKQCAKHGFDLLSSVRREPLLESPTVVLVVQRGGYGSQALAAALGIPILETPVTASGTMWSGFTALMAESGMFGCKASLGSWTTATPPSS